MADPFTLTLNAASGLKTAIDLTKTLVDVRDNAKLAAIKSELLGLLLEAREESLTLAAEKRELAERVRQFEQWDRDAEGYKLADIGNGCMAYVEREPSGEAENQPALCANCYHERRKSILVPYYVSAGRAKAMQCHACGSEMITYGVDLRDAGKRGPVPGRRR